ncbi:NAD(P)-binding protein [Eremomyces bilateralis CBS 781.70]|uniref:NAD(P)-binding protein n=1 Tax=Eremomyces bilateralis CBS 781.70 TaxID=1392243 RepID=A0A6G1G2L7_9PEZI|nr:NAD(P)-binding protein [Eremomyces bilateralis CBS 781.70]KAF1812232.1 NAD(P)-binding protein [Eremomyces bilateralis CBS 781.70]
MSGLGDCATPLWRNLINSQWFTTSPLPTQSFEGQTIIVTGANTGLGKQAANHFVRLHAAKVIIAIRSLKKGDEAKEWIEQETGPGSWRSGISTSVRMHYASVKDFAAKAQTLDRLDVLLENAAVSPAPTAASYSVAEDNEVAVTVNVVSTFLLDVLLLPKLRESAKTFDITPRLVVVTSEAHFATTLKPERNHPDGIFNYLNDKSTARMAGRYAATKLLELFVVREMVRAHAPIGYPVIINLVNPGFCHSEFLRGQDIMAAIFRFFLHARPMVLGAGTLVDGPGKGQESHGQYLADMRVAPISPFVLSKEGRVTQERVWNELTEKLEAIQPGIMNNF